jgi:putative phage-type endonuclease
MWNLLEQKIERKYPFVGNKFTEHGNKYEKTALQMFQKKLGIDIKTENDTIYHPEFPWITGRVDGYTETNEIVEIKCPWSRGFPKTRIDQVPIEYWVQCQMYMHMTRTARAYYVEYHVRPGSPLDGSAGCLLYTTIDRNDDWWSNTIPKLCSFYEQLQYWSEKGSLDEHPARIAERNWSNQVSGL